MEPKTETERALEKTDIIIAIAKRVADAGFVGDYFVPIFNAAVDEAFERGHFAVATLSTPE